MDLAPQLAALAQVIIIDLSMAADNAVVIGSAAAGLPKEQRHRAVMLGLAGAVIIRIILACFAVKLLDIAGLTLAGGLLLFWVAWKMARKLRDTTPRSLSLKEWILRHARWDFLPLVGRVRVGGVPHGQSSILKTVPSRAPPHLTSPTRGEELDRASLTGSSLTENPGQKNLRAAVLQILAADLGMSLDNVLGVAGAANDHYGVLAIGLVLSVALVGAAATFSAKLFHRYPWLGWIGIATVLYVAVSMMADGVLDIHQVVTGVRGF